MPAKLPTMPDFAAVEALAPGTTDQRTRIFALIGNLIFSWSNNESMFIYVLMILLDTDFNSAAVTFVTLNTTRARLDLVRRLAKVKIADKALVRRLERLIERFDACTRLRNEFNHCVYSVNERGEITHADILRVVERKDGIKIAHMKHFDAERLREITNVITRLRRFNRDIWAFLPELEQGMAKPVPKAD